MTTESIQLLNIAEAQKGVLWCLLANIVCILFPIGWLIILPFAVYYTYKLAQSLECGPLILWCIGMFIPILHLILLLILSQLAIGRLKGAGIKVGLMGANIEEVREKMYSVESGDEGNT